MRHVTLGRTGLPVSRLCLGTMTFGLQCDEAASFAILDAAAEAGITFLDTADVYPLGGTGAEVGRTEEIIGRWLQGKRDDFIVATKCVGVMSRRRWDRGASRKHIKDAVEASLRRLGTDRIDLYQLHSDDPDTPIEESLSALDDLVHQGKIGYVGCSNFASWQLALSLGRSEARNLARFDCIQPRYNLLYRRNELELFPLCEQEGIGVIPYNPIAGGMLSGKHRPGAATEGTRFTLGSAAGRYQDRYWHDPVFDTVEELKRLAEEAGMPLVTLAVAWCLAQPAITSPIIGASRPDQLQASIAALDVTLDADLYRRIDEATRSYRASAELR
ncbi:MAG: aldo/keto reductase [Acidimicrobiia bacterium]|nr:aldo/keto reductase [Acidimicrobiia bacterium]MDH5289043.1 aldo/keto reductase [Acidimicrobiia bacterium]